MEWAQEFVDLRFADCKKSFLVHHRIKSKIDTCACAVPLAGSKAEETWAPPSSSSSLLLLAATASLFADDSPPFIPAASILRTLPLLTASASGCAPPPMGGGCGPTSWAIVRLRRSRVRRPLVGGTVWHSGFPDALPPSADVSPDSGWLPLLGVMMTDGRPATGYVADRLVGVAGWAGGEPGAGRAGGALRLPVSEAAGWPAVGTGACRVTWTSWPAGGLFPGIL